MPPCDFSATSMLGKAIVWALSATMKYPPDLEMPQDEGDSRYSDGFDPGDLVGIPAIPAFFSMATMNKHHTETAKEIATITEDWWDEALGEAKTAIDMWRPQVKVASNVKIMAVCAIGAPGAFDHPTLDGSWTMWGTDSGKPWDYAFAKGLSKSWDSWADGMSIPGLPIAFALFAAYPGPTAPPTPGISMPTVVFISTGLADMLPTTIADNIIAEFKDSDAAKECKNKYYENVFKGMGVTLSLGWLMWTLQQMIMLPNGKGPCPGYSPPYVPVFPCIAGDFLPTPVMAS